MKERLRRWWDKYEMWIAPCAMFMFLISGIQVGIWIGVAQENEQHVTQVWQLNNKIAEKDEIIETKDKRLAELEQKTVSGEVIEAVKAAAAQSSAESAKQLSEQNNGASTSNHP